ncbi:uncharacterized protein Dana_GF19545 [Drosophila ananassae]|uniref:Uncharacterized protein n=1 Tax=Drosophila ananassae TaxID=7217 RepID=A0A0N8P0L8_DROAN|nr:uncharacterized protein Dana_GF19545 [Drosophila ananassae]
MPHHSGQASTEDYQKAKLRRVKRRDHDVEGEPVELDPKVGPNEKEEEPLVVPKREKKLVTKASLAKKALKKNLQVNSKVKFDEEGESVVDGRSQMKALARKQMDDNDDDDDDDDGGIDLVRSKALLTEEDQYDKQRFRELVKKRHKLQREKLRKKAEAAKGSSDEEEEEEDDHDHHNPDAASDNCGDDDDDDDNSDEEPAYKKSKLTNKLTLLDTEAIAASLLGS